MPRGNLFSEYPQEFRVSTARPDVRYIRLTGHFAVHGPVPAPWASQVVARFDGGKIAVCRGDPGDQPTGGASVVCGPVYARGPDGSPAVPTGLVFVRFREDVRAEGRRQALSQAGYVVKEIAPYAPHAVWVEASSGGIADALNGIPRLEALSDVVNVEPQMLSERARR
jgi:hypothetical protein